MSNAQDLVEKNDQLARLVGIQSSKLNYYQELKQKLSELEQKNDLLQQAKATTDELYKRSRLQALRLDQALSSLAGISHALTTTTQGVDVLLQTIMRTITNIFDTPFVVLISDEGNNQRRIVHQPAAAPSGSLLDHLLQHLADAAEQMASTLQPARIEAVAATGDLDQTGTQFLCVPMMRAGTLVGAICLQINEDRGIDDYDLATCQILANQAAVAIQNAHLFEESRRLQAKSETLYRLAVEQKDKAEQKSAALQAALAEIDTMEREQIISAERERIARDLHDSVAQILTSIGINLEWCRQHLPSKSPLRERIVLLKRLARNGLYEIRSAILGLTSADVAEVGLAAALEKLVGDFEKIAGITACFECHGDERRFDIGVEDALYYICQEALYNVFKHAQAHQVKVTLIFTDQALSLTVIDDGIGIDPVVIEPPVQGGVTFGLNNMAQRITALKGNLSVKNVNGTGTRVVASVSTQELTG